MSAAYRPEIDGLRAFAVVPVVLFHLDCPWIPGGFVGVDVFFVISGYLITRILLGELEQGTFTFREFWIRRVLRIFPALLTTIAVTLAASWLLAPRTDHPAIGQQAAAALASVANLWFWTYASDYWGAAAESSPLLHTWSLSVEEQFYLCLPLMLRAASAWGPRAVRVVIAAVTAASAAHFAHGIATSDFADVFYLLPARAWELGVGGCLAAIHARTSGRVGDGGWPGRLLALAGLTLIVTVFLLTPGRTRAVTGAVAGTALVLAFGAAGPCYRILVLPPVVAIGKASYSIYLWHWPIIVLAEFLGIEGRTWLQSALIGLLGAGSYWLIEQPTRRWRAGLPWIGAGYVAVLAAAGALALSSGTYDTTAFMIPPPQGVPFDLGHLSDEVPAAEGVPTVPRAEKDRALRSGGLVIGGHESPDIVVVGDSHGVMWSPAIRDAAARLGLTASFATANGVSPFIDVATGRQVWDKDAMSLAEKAAFDAGRLEAIARWKPRVVIVAGRWSGYRDTEADPLLTFLTRHSGRVLLIEQPPELTIGNRNVVQWLRYKGVMPESEVRRYLPEGNVEDNARGRRRVRELAARHTGCEVVPTRDLYVAEDGRVLVLDGRKLVYDDDDHLTDHGASLAGPRIEAALEDTSAPP